MERMKKMSKWDQKTVYSAIQPISYETAGTIIQRGNSFYFRLDPDFIKYHELKPGDRVKLRAVSVRVLIKKDGEWK